MKLGLNGMELDLDIDSPHVKFAVWLLKKYPDYYTKGDSMTGMAKKVIEGLQKEINEDDQIYPDLSLFGRV